ncbi:MAG: group II intron maturase-specific domain-containing protein [Microcoleaceae cyanobacterium]
MRGSSNYYSSVVRKTTYTKLDQLVFEKLRAWAKSRGKGRINRSKEDNIHKTRSTGF